MSASDRRSDQSPRPVSAPAWTVPVVVEQIPEHGLHRDLAPDPEICAALASLGSLQSLENFSAGFDLNPAGQGRVHVTGRVMATVGQVCVVTLEPLKNAVEEAIDLMFAPPEQITSLAREVDEDSEAHDAPEPIVDGAIDLAQLATDVLFLAIDPYPRKADAVFEHQPTPADPSDHPFAALQSLKNAPESSPKKPPKR